MTLENGESMAVDNTHLTDIITRLSDVADDVRALQADALQAKKEQGESVYPRHHRHNHTTITITTTTTTTTITITITITTITITITITIVISIVSIVG